jgi:hypothetical protein
MQIRKNGRNEAMNNQRETTDCQDLTLEMLTSQENISHRKLSPAEARAIWTILHPSSSLSAIHELRIILKPEIFNGARGWMICTQ